MSTFKQDKIFKGSIKLPVFHLKLNDPENMLCFILNLEKELSFNLLKQTK